MKIMTIITLSAIIFISGPFSDLQAEDNASAIATRLLAQNITTQLTTITSSVKALADAYVRLYEQTPVMPEQDQRKWLDRSFGDTRTVQFRPFNSGPEPGFQAAQAGYFFYHGKQLTANVWREFNTFTLLAPMLKLSYDTFSDSWVYLTTTDGAFVIYPYLPLAEAVHNYPPTEQVFYTAADFKHRAPGWTPPYQDLAGAGMMVTVSCPVYMGDKLLGVLARDITLTQLANQVLKPVTASDPRFICLIITNDGLAIANSQAEGMQEIIAVNTEAKSAVLYYRAQKTLQGKAGAGSRISARALYNLAGQLALEAAGSDPESGIRHFTLEDNGIRYRASAARIKTTDWLVITLHP